MRRDHRWVEGFLLGLFLLIQATAPPSVAQSIPPQDRERARFLELAHQAKTAQRFGQKTEAQKLLRKAQPSAPGGGAPGWLDALPPAVHPLSPAEQKAALLASAAQALDAPCIDALENWLIGHPWDGEVRRLLLAEARRIGNRAMEVRHASFLGEEPAPPPNQLGKIILAAIFLTLLAGLSRRWLTRQPKPPADGTSALPHPILPDVAHSPAGRVPTATDSTQGRRESSPATEADTGQGVEDIGVSGYIAAMHLVEALSSLLSSGKPAMRLFQILMAESPVWMSLFTPEGRLISINPSGVRMLGRHEGEILGLSLAEILPDSHVPDFRTLFSGPPADGRVTFALQISQRDGQDQDFEVSLLAIAGPDGSGEDTNPPGFLALFQKADLPPSKPEDTGTSPSEIKHLSHRLIEDLPYWISLVTTDGLVETINHAGLVHLGCSEASVVGRPLWDLFPPPDGERLRDCFLNLNQTGRERIEVSLPCPGEGSFVFEATLTRLSGNGGTDDNRCTAIFSDITGRKRAEEEMQASRHQLEERLRAREADLANLDGILKAEVAGRRQAEEERRRIEEELRLAREIAAAPPHQEEPALESPLVALATDAAHTEPPPPPAPPAQEPPPPDSDEPGLLQPLAIPPSSPTPDLVPPSTEVGEATFDLAELLDRIRTRCLSLAESRGLALHWTYDPPAPRQVVGLEDHLRRAMAGLVSHSLQSITEGEVTVGIRYLPDQSGQGLLRAAIENTGPGLPPDQLDQLFLAGPAPVAAPDPTSREADPEPWECKRLLVHMKGSVSARSAPETGTTFFLFVPLALTDRPLYP